MRVWLFVCACLSLTLSLPHFLCVWYGMMCVWYVRCTVCVSMFHILFRLFCFCLFSLFSLSPNVVVVVVFSLLSIEWYFFSRYCHICVCFCVLMFHGIALDFFQPFKLFRNIWISLLLLFVCHFGHVSGMYERVCVSVYRCYLHFSQNLFSVMLQNQQFLLSK